MLVNFALVFLGFVLGFFTCAILSINKMKDEPSPDEVIGEWVASPAPRADCMPPGCNDYPECNHRY